MICTCVYIYISIYIYVWSLIYVQIHSWCGQSNQDDTITYYNIYYVEEDRYDTSRLDSAENIQNLNVR